MSISNQVPFIRLFNSSPDYGFLRTFGCACYPLLRPYNRHKLQFLSLECIFLGYAPNHKGYKCLTPSGRIYLSRDVLFNESKFPTTLITEQSPCQTSQIDSFVSATPPLVQTHLEHSNPVHLSPSSSTSSSDSNSQQSVTSSDVGSVDAAPTHNNLHSNNSSRPLLAQS